LPLHLVDERCSRTVLDFLTSTDMGRLVPAEKEDEVSQMSEVEFWEWMEKQGVRDTERGDVGEPPLFLPMPDFMVSANEG